MNSHAPREAVILIHGLAAHRLIMSRLARFLSQHNYRVTNWGYPSIRWSITRHSARLLDLLEDHDRDSALDRFHLVTHSMGGIITRHALTQKRPGKLTRWVMLGPPNKGSHVARWLARGLGGLCPPLHELSDQPGSLVRQLAEPTDVELGVIAAAADHVVRVASTHLTTQRDHLVLPGRHSELPFRADTARAVLSFLRGGRFTAPAAS